MLSLRPYQQEVADRIRAEMRNHKSILVRLPTGGGKTAIATDVTQKAVAKGNSVYFICHRQELIDQTAKTFMKAGLTDISFIANGFPHRKNCLIQICSIGTLASRLSKTDIPKLAIFDEAHHLGAAGWEKVKSAFCSSWHIGLSATPHRLDGKGLGKYFTTMIEGRDESWLIENGYLSKYKLITTDPPDLSAVHTQMGDYQKTELQAAMDKSSITGDIIKHWQQFAEGKRTILFAVSIEHSQHMVAQFRAAGIEAEHLDGTSTRDERKAVAKRFADGEIQVLSNVNLFGEGYDLSAQAERDVTVDCVIQARPTQSMALHRQQVGRALRPKADGSRAIILDHAGNVWRLGFPDDDYPWSLEGHDRKKGKQEKDILMKVCPRCKGAHRPATRCPYCDYQYPVVAREIEQREGELKELVKGEAKILRMKEMGQNKTLDELIEYGRKKGYKNPAGWAAHVWTARMAKRQQRAV